MTPAQEAKLVAHIEREEAEARRKALKEMLADLKDQHKKSTISLPNNIPGEK